MRYFYFALIVIGILLALGLVIWLLVRLRMHIAKRRVCESSTEEKKRELNNALAPFGFLYDERDDSISAGMYPWQRETGYCRKYDEAAPTMYMIIDCEPIYFDYNDGRYLIEVWKGQYGCTTGAEIGVYVNRTADWEEPPENLFYECVSDEERLPMQFALYRNGNQVLHRSAVHWWLTGFCVGMYSERQELTLEVGIGFPNASMCNAFCDGLMQAGYTRKDFRVERNNVFFRFDKPRSKQPDFCKKGCRKRIMRRNRKNCRLYCKVTKDFQTTLDKITYIGYCFPRLYRAIVKVGSKSNKRKLKKYKRKVQKTWG